MTKNLTCILRKETVHLSIKNNKNARSTQMEFGNGDTGTQLFSFFSKN
jgi:hypothetical protein